METKHKKRDENSLRVCSFNINGLNTLFNYYPWNSSKDLGLAFAYLQCDIITLQELKLSKVTSALLLKNYKSFITIPRAKKGYSGVGVYVRQVQDNSYLQKLLTVRKVEEGITGNLTLPSNKLMKYRDADDSDEVIGGYPEVYNNPLLDDEGRCICIELNYDIVVISLYCPANSLGTEEGEIYRMKFLHALIERCEKLIEMGKQVIVMGDINVSRDLIDSDEHIKQGISMDCIRKVVFNDHTKTMDEQGMLFEDLNEAEVVRFRELTGAKKLINSVVIDQYIETHFNQKIERPFFIDTFRKSQGRRLKMYTCWNTLKNARPINSGSRIDHIFATQKLSMNCYADILNKLMGSDHCPIYCDFNLEHYTSTFTGTVYEPLDFIKFEARNYYGVDNGGNIIDKFFGKHTMTTTKRTHTESKLENPIRREKPVYVSRKKNKIEAGNGGQLGITNFFFKPTTLQEHQEEEELTKSNSQSSQLSMEAFANLLSSGNSGSPNCLHDEPATLRTSMKSLTKGKKFWCCARSLTSDTFDVNGESEEERCDFFKWASK